MAKARVVEETIRYTKYYAFEYPEGGYWELHFDGQNLSMSREDMDDLILFLKKLRKKEGN